MQIIKQSCYSLHTYSIHYRVCSGLKRKLNRTTVENVLLCAQDFSLPQVGQKEIEVVAEFLPQGIV